MPSRTTGDWVTVLIPAYQPDRSEFGECLASLRAQTHPRTVVCVSWDRGQEDPPPNLPELPHLIWHTQPQRLGWMDNVNWLLGNVDTPYFTVLGHDDRLSPDFIAKTVALLEQRPEAIVAHGETHHFGVREGEVAFTPAIRGDRLTRVLEFIDRGPDRAEMGWRGVMRSSAAAGIRLRGRRSDGMFSNTLFVLELLVRGDSEAIEGIKYEKYTHPVTGLSRDYHRRTAEQKSAMLADNLACLVDVLRDARFSDDEQELVVARYAEWLMALQGNWNVISEAENSDTQTYADVRPAMARFLANALVSMAAEPPERDEPKTGESWLKRMVRRIFAPVLRQRHA